MWLVIASQVWLQQARTVNSPLHPTGERLFRLLQRHAGEIPSTPSSASTAHIIHQPLPAPLPATLAHVVADLHVSEDHEVFDFLRLRHPIQPPSVAELLGCLFQVVLPGPHHSSTPLYGVSGIQSTDNGIRQTALQALPYELDVRSAVDTQWQSVILPPLAIRHAQSDHYGSSQYVVHLCGRVLWIMWPPSSSNLQFIATLDEATVGPTRTASYIQHLEGLEFLYLQDVGTKFILPPHTIYACVTFECAVYTVKSITTLEHVNQARQVMTWKLDWLMANLYASISLVTLKKESIILAEDLTRWIDLVEGLEGTIGHDDVTSVSIDVASLERQLSVVWERIYLQEQDMNTIRGHVMDHN